MDEQLVTIGGELKALGDAKSANYLVRFGDAETPDARATTSPLIPTLALLTGLSVGCITASRWKAQRRDRRRAIRSAYATPSNW